MLTSMTQPRIQRFLPYSPFGMRRLGQEDTPTNGATPVQPGFLAPLAGEAPVNRSLLLGGGAFLTLAGGGQLVWSKNRTLVPMALAGVQTLIGLVFLYNGIK